MVWHGLVHNRGASFVALLAALLLNTGQMMAAHRGCSATGDPPSAVDGVGSCGSSFRPTQVPLQECAGEPEVNDVNPGRDHAQPALFYLMLVGFGVTGGAFLSRRLSAARYGMRH